MKSFISVLFGLGLLLPINLVFAQKVSLAPIQQEIDTLKSEIENLKDVSYISGLEKSIEILDRTNNSLTQRWTPTNVLLMGLAALFSAITIAWGFVFAFGYLAYRRIQKHKKTLALELKSLRKNGEEAINSITNGGEELLKQLKGKKRTAAQIEKELEKFKEKAKKEIERLEDKTFGAVTSAGGTASVLGGWNNESKTNLDDVRTCSKCGNLFRVLDEWNPRERLNTIQPTPSPYVQTLTIDRIYKENPLCKRCRKETRS